MSMPVLTTNILANHPSYPKILAAYNDLLKANGGSVNNLRFWREVILPEIPGYSKESWYKFLKRFKTSNGIVNLTPVANPVVAGEKGIVEGETKIELMTNQQATASLIQRALNISATAARRIAEDPSLLSLKDQIEIGLKAMKAQDSRIHAIGKIREDNREQEKFDRAFDQAAY